MSDTSEPAEEINKERQLTEQLNQLIKDNEELKDKYYRSRAEAENASKRASEDVLMAYKYSLESIAKKMIVIKDSLDLSTKDDNLDSIKNGIAITIKQFDDFFKSLNIRIVYPAIGDKFSLAEHHAISISESATEEDDGKITQVLQCGYFIEDRMLRAALVVVSKFSKK